MHGMFLRALCQIVKTSRTALPGEAASNPGAHREGQLIPWFKHVRGITWDVYYTTL